MIAIGFGSNLLALRSIRRMADATAKVSDAYGHLSSGQRIVRPSDDAAGLAISSSLNNDRRVFGQAVRNVNDGISALNIADGTVGQLSSVVTRLRELATQSASGSFSLQQRQALQKEADALVREYNRSIASARFNGRGLLDGSLGGLTLQTGYGNSATLRAGLGDGLSHTVGTGLFGSSQTGPGSDSILDMASGDFNGDGILDVVQGDQTGSPLYVYLGGSNGFTSGSSLTNGNSTCSSVVCADFNGDGKVDIAAEAGSKFVIFCGNGNGTFQSALTSNGTLGSNAIAADLNGDGAADLIDSSGSSVRVFMNLGNGTFQTSVSYSAGAAVQQIRVGDLTGDGRTDLAVRAGNSLRWLQGNGQGQFGTIQNLGVAARDIAVGDFNRDGVDDLAGHDGSSHLSVVLANGNGSFQSAVSYSAASGGASERFATDMNGDGYLDLISAGGLLLGNGDGTFATEVSLGLSGSYIVLGDFSGDGISDFVLADGGGSRFYSGRSTNVTSAAGLNIATRAGALDALQTLETLSRRLATEQGNIGNAMARADSSLSHLITVNENYAAASSRIGSIDVAEESAKLVRTKIQQEVATALIAQANQLPEIGLDLLKARDT